MNRVRLGKTGLMVSRVGMGGIPIQRPAEDEAITLIRRALDLGVNLIDTAAGYGESEERIGKALVGRRDQAIIATKSGRRSKAEAASELERSLKRLRTDVIDIWQLHNISSAEAYDQVTGPGGSLEAAQEALQAGKIADTACLARRGSTFRETLAPTTRASCSTSPTPRAGTIAGCSSRTRSRASLTTTCGPPSASSAASARKSAPRVSRSASGCP
jgi:aryl-alcohol dehydrogenase-like predicted oxidoreductase